MLRGGGRGGSGEGGAVGSGAAPCCGPCAGWFAAGACARSLPACCLAGACGSCSLSTWQLARAPHCEPGCCVPDAPAAALPRPAAAGAALPGAGHERHGGNGAVQVRAAVWRRLAAARSSSSNRVPGGRGRRPQPTRQPPSPVPSGPACKPLHPPACSELDLLLSAARRLGVRPSIGIRAKLSTRHAGHWGSTSGDKAKVRGG